MAAPAPSPRVLAAMQRQAAKGWTQLREHPEGFAIGDAGVPPHVAAAAQGWKVLVAGEVTLAQRGRLLLAVGSRAGRPWAVPVDLGEDGDDSSTEAR
jgi:hypothetical protein